MADRVRELLNKLLEWWNRFSTKQRTFIIAASAGAVIAIAILLSVVTKPKYVLLLDAQTTKEASEVRDLLEAEGLLYQISDDGNQIRIKR